MGLSIYDERAPVAVSVYWVNADGAIGKDLIPATRPSRIDRIYVYSDDTVDHDVTLWTGGTGVIPILTATIPAGAGTSVGVPVVELISLLPGPPDGWLLGTGDKLNLQLLVAVAAGKYLGCYGTGGTL